MEFKSTSNVVVSVKSSLTEMTVSLFARTPNGFGLLFHFVVSS